MTSLTIWARMKTPATSTRVFGSRSVPGAPERCVGRFVDRATPVKAGRLSARPQTTVEEAQVTLDRIRSTNRLAIEDGQVDLNWNQRELARKRKRAGNMFSKANEIDEYLT